MRNNIHTPSAHVLHILFSNLLFDLKLDYMHIRTRSVGLVRDIYVLFFNFDNDNAYCYI
jgi:hypothetical protein